MATQSFYPNIGTLVTINDFPEELQFLEIGLQNALDKIYYKELQYVKSSDGSQGYYNIVLVTGEPLKLDFMDTGFSVVINPGSAGETLIPITVNYNWPVLAFIKNFNLQSFSYLPDQLQEVMDTTLSLSDTDLIQSGVQIFEGDDSSASYNNFVDKVNLKYNLSGSNLIPYPTSGTSLDMAEEIRVSIEDSSIITDNIKAVIDGIYIYSTNNSDYQNNLNQFSQGVTSQSIMDYVKEIIIPKIDASLDIAVGLAFPRSLLLPINPTTNEPLPEPEQSILVFDVGTLLFSTQGGINFEQEMAVSLNHPSEIGNTGLGIDIQHAKLDLSQSTNIIEADLDGRPQNFTGVYAKYVAITLPPRWFNNVDNTTLRIAGYNMLIGTGGVSGTIALEAVNGTPATGDDYLNVNIGNWQLGFNSFDITFKQSDVVSSNIRARLEIPSFKKPNGEIAEIDVVGHLEANGDFKLTASTTPPYPTIEFGDVFKLHMESVELGREDDDFFIRASCDLEFMGLLGGFLEGQSISISSLRIYSNGRIEFHVEGGNLTLPKPIKLNLGPVQLSVTALHFGSSEREKEGIMRKYNYFGFDGGVNIGIAGLDARGDGIKFYYTVDDGPGKSPDSYLHIQTIHVDLVIPANSSDPNVMLKGWLSIPEPGVSPEYRGGVDLKLKNPRISGKVDMRLAPKYPAFLIDAGIELPNPIALGPVSIYGFRGLLGYRYVAEKEAVPGLTSDSTWYEYYKAPERGVNVNKFSGPEKTKDYSAPVSLGVGAILGDTMALGNILSANAMLLLSLPSMVMVDARMKLLSKRVTFADDPPFFAFFIIGDNSMEFGFGADYKFPENSGDIIKIYAEIQAGFFFDNPSAWYINIGTQQNPITASILKDLFSFKSYVMLSGAGIRAGARGEIRFERSIGPFGVKFLAYMELGGYVSFERPQMGGYFEVGIEVSLKMVVVDFYLAVTAILAVESPKPFKIYGKFKVKIRVKVLFIPIEASATVELKWEFNNTVDRTPVNPMTENTGQIDGLVKGVSMLTGETFDLANLRQTNGQINIDLEKIRKKVIPLDTYVDIKTTKGLIPSEQVNSIIGGLNTPPERYTDLIPPRKVMKGIEVRQVKHKYSIEEIKIMAHNPKYGWQPYNPYKAMYPDNTEPQLNNMKAGQWQKKDNSYNAIRVLGISPFSYTEQGLPGWFIPEQYGVTAHTLFCQGVERAPHLSHFLYKDLGTVYWASEDTFFESMEANYQIPGETDYNLDPQGNMLPAGIFGRITNRPNVFDYKQSLEYPFGQPLVIMLSEPSVEVQIKQSTTAETLFIECYRPLINNELSTIEYELVTTKEITGAELSQPIQIAFPENMAVTKLIMYTANIRKEWDMLHEVTWVTLEDYEYNINIPSQEEIDDDTESTLSAVNDYLPPIWRPDTSYYVQFKLKDNVDNGENEAFYDFAYGFHTAGPVGFFHTDEYSPYGSLNGNDADQYPHTSLRAYIDYDRSYPNADGDLISAKPMFYNDTTTEVNLFFTSRYADRMLTGWGAYDNFPALGGTMKIIIKDPVENIEIVNPPNLETTYESIELSPLPIPQTIETWALDESPLLSNTITQWFNMLPEGCTAVYEDPEPLTYYRKIETKRLKPQKLYTVQILNFYWGTEVIDPENITENDKNKFARPVHQYVFQTSRYRNFEDQVMSYYTYDEEDIVTSEKTFAVEIKLDSAPLEAALTTVKGVPNELSISIETQFQHPFDRVLEGLFGLPALDKAMTTEICKIVNANSNKIVALLIRNPEPFNHPRFPLEVVSRVVDEEDNILQEGMIEVLMNDLSDINPAYHVLYSKDYAQAIIMNDIKQISGSTLNIQFIYKIWNGATYPIVDIQKIIDVPIN